ncbi:small ubiquitin-related modifier 1-like [Pyrus ussuriensis x Pyrus communis]|uniref:Small ubiquitin-related modifier 1-like n=1 Tax=Pyrus ussuriensis x Pyrus communis TaxID=2448454 RepID=A0A5N5FSC7_9ROSA|nr:small ubiquitin-related modifier 1-like [Pyrus ussuriensis x Pyrus communis]
MFFRMKPSTPLKRCTSAYCSELSVALDDVMFSHGGRSIGFDITPDQLGMEMELKLMYHLALVAVGVSVILEWHGWRGGCRDG